MNSNKSQIKVLLKDYNELLRKENKAVTINNGCYQRYTNHIFIAAHALIKF